MRRKRENKVDIYTYIWGFFLTKEKEARFSRFFNWALKIWPWHCLVVFRVVLGSASGWRRSTVIQPCVWETHAYWLKNCTNMIDTYLYLGSLVCFRFIIYIYIFMCYVDQNLVLYIFWKLLSELIKSALFLVIAQHGKFLFIFAGILVSQLMQGT